jgi:hypothetical protein
VSLGVPAEDLSRVFRRNASYAKPACDGRSRSGRLSDAVITKAVKRARESGRACATAVEKIRWS